METTEDTLIKESDRGDRAKRLVEDPLFEEAFKSVVDQFNSAMLDTKAGEAEFREVCYHALQGSRLFLAQLKKHIDTGEMAKHSLEQIRKGDKGLFRGNQSPWDAVDEYL